MKADRSAWDITFRPVTASDLPMLARWMEQAHWREWWGDPKDECAMIRDMVERRDTTRPFIFQIDGRDCGYIQVWIAADQMVEPWISAARWMAALPQGAVGVDLSVGDGADLGKGIGSSVLTAFVALLHAEGRREIFIDPSPMNARAIRAYEKAGFRVYAPLHGKTDDCLIMRHEG